MYSATATAINPDDRTVYGVYKPRNPAASHYFQCVSAHWEELEPAWDVCYQRQYGFFRSYVKEVMLRFSDGGDLHNGFARVRCHDCGHEYLLAFSCKRRHPRRLEDKLLSLLPSKKNDTGIENLARYIIQAAFSQERMQYIPASATSDGRAKVIYQSKDGRERKIFPALIPRFSLFLTAMTFFWVF